MRQPARHIPLVGLPHRHGEARTVMRVVVTKNLNERIALGNCPISVSVTRIKKRRHLEFRVFTFQQVVIGNRLGDARRRKNRMELARHAQDGPIVNDVLNDRPAMLVTVILARRKRRLDCRHRRLSGVHHPEIDLSLALVRQGLRLRRRMNLFKRNSPSEVNVLVRQDLARVETEDILVVDAVRNRIAVKFVSEDGCRPLIWASLENGRTGKTEEHCLGESGFDVEHHVTTYVLMRFVHNEDDTLVAQLLDVGEELAVCLVLDASHLLDGRDNEATFVVGTLQLGDKRSRRGGRLDGRHFLDIPVVQVFPRKATVISERLRAKFSAVEQKHNLVRRARFGYELRRLEACERLAATRRVPDVSAKPRLSALPLVVLAHLLEDLPRGVELVRTHHLENAVRRVGHRIEPDELVRHRDRQ